MLGSLVLAACGETPTPTPASSSTGTNTGAQAADPNEEYIFVSCLGNLEFFNAVKYGWKWGGEKLGVKTSYVGPAEFDLNAQVAAFDQAIARKPKGIAVFAVDPVLTPAINKAVEAGIPVVTVIGDQPDSKRLAYVGSNQYDLGFMGGQRIAEAINGEGKVAILSIPGTQMFDDRAAGYEAAFAKYPGIEVVQTGDTKADTVTAVNVAKDILTRYPDLAAFVGTDSTGGIGAGTAVKEAGKQGQVKVVAMDRNSDVLDLIDKGVLYGTVAQDDVDNPYWALLTLYNYVHNQAPLTNDNAAAGVTTGPSFITTHANWVDKNNLKHFLDANSLYATAK
jgi:ribose transport system substrate-binding protein